MQKAEAKNWNHTKESFDQYAIEKMALIRRLNPLTENVIDLLIREIWHNSIRATAWAGELGRTIFGNNETCGKWHE